MIPARNLPIGKIVRNALLFRVGRQAMLDDQISQIVGDLFGLLDARNIEYLLVGGIALLNYVEGRNTEDIDLILAVADLARLPELDIASQDENFARASYRGLRVDLLFARNPIFDYVRRTYAAQGLFNQRPISVVAPEGLIFLKFYALPSLYRQGDFERVALYETDLVMLLHRFPLSADAILAVLSRHLAVPDVQSLRDIYAEIEARIRRYSNRAP
jgi:hypothetical protein